MCNSSTTVNIYFPLMLTSKMEVLSSWMVWAEFRDPGFPGLGSVIFRMFPVWQTSPQPIKRERNKYHQVGRFPRQGLEVDQVTYRHIPLAGTQLHGHISLQRKWDKSTGYAQDDGQQPHSSVQTDLCGLRLPPLGLWCSPRCLHHLSHCWRKAVCLIHSYVSARGVNFKSRRLKNDYSFHKKTNRKFCCFLGCYFVGWVGWLAGKTGSKNALSKVLNPQKKASSKSQSDFWKIGKKLQIK